MKQFAKKAIVLLAALALIVGILPANGAQAAKKKKTATITVTTQEELVAALKKYSSSGEKVKIRIATSEKGTFTLNAKYSSENLQIIVDAPNATIKSKAKVSSITINEAKSVKEYASGNKITVNDEKLTFTAMENASVEKLTIASETGTVKVVNNGGIEKVAVKSEVKVDLTQNGEVGRVYVGAAADISVSGTAEESLKVTVQKDAVGASVKSEVPVSVNAYADVDLTLEKGAENSKVTMKEENAGVKLENNTEETVSVKDTEGKTQKVETGEDLTTDNFVGKTDESETTEGTVTEQPKEEEQKEEEKKEEKEEEKKDDTASTESTYYPPTTIKTPEEKLRDSLAALVGSSEDEVLLEENITLTSDLTIPANKGLALADGVTLNAEDHKIVLGPDSRISVLINSKLIIGRNHFEFTPDQDGFTAAEIMLKFGAELTIDGYTVTGPGNNEIDPVPTRIHFENQVFEEKNNAEPESAIKYTDRRVTFDLLGEKLLFQKTDGTFEGVAKAFGTETSHWESDNSGFGDPVDGGVYTTLDISYLPNVLYDTRTVCFNDTPIQTFTTGPEDWITCFLDPGVYWFSWAARKMVTPERSAPVGVTRTPDGYDEDGALLPGDIFVTVDNSADFEMKKAVNVRNGGTLKIASDVCKRILGKTGSICADWGGKIAIGDYLFETKDHGSIPLYGLFGITISNETMNDGSGKQYVKLQLPEDVVIRKFNTSNNEVSEFASSDISEFNTWANTNGIRVEIHNKSRINYHGSEPWDPDYFPSIKIGNDYIFAIDGKLVKGEYTGTYNEATKKFEYSTGTLTGLMAIWNIIERPVVDSHANPKWSTITLTDSLNLEHMTMSLPATIEIKDSKNLTLNNNAHLTASVNVASGSAVTVGGADVQNKSCSLSTTQGGNCEIYGKLTVNDGSTFTSQMGKNLFIQDGGIFELNGTFVCGAEKYKTKDSGVLTSTLFENNGTVTGTGTVKVKFTAIGEGISFTAEEKTDKISQVRSEIKNSGFTVEEFGQ